MEIHKEVDNILKTSQKTLQQIKVSGLAKLQQQEEHLDDAIKRMKQDVETYENQLQDANPNAFLEFKQDPGQNKDKTKSPTLETPPSPVFTMGPIDANALQDIFGSFLLRSYLRTAQKQNRTVEKYRRGAKKILRSQSVHSWQL